MSEPFELRGGCRVVKIRGMDYDERIDFMIQMLRQKIAILRGAMEGCSGFPQQTGNQLYSMRLCNCIGCYKVAQKYSERAKADNSPKDLCSECNTDLERAVVRN